MELGMSATIMPWTRSPLRAFVVIPGDEIGRDFVLVREGGYPIDGGLEPTQRPLATVLRRLRAKLRSLRNAASAMIASTKSDTARALAWFATEYATQALYAPDAAHALDDLNKLCTRFMLTAMQAEQIDLERFAE